jgi:hypothetical protein
MSLAMGLELCVGAALFMSVCYVDLCTKMCVKKQVVDFRIVLRALSKFPGEGK